MSHKTVKVLRFRWSDVTNNFLVEPTHVILNKANKINGTWGNHAIPNPVDKSKELDFSSIKTNLNIAATEISDLQNKVVLKQALANTTLNNDMGNTLISNASILSFRATTNDLGNNLSGTVLIDLALGDVQYGTVAGDVVLNFGNWSPTGTQSTIQLQLDISNTEAIISFPPEIVSSNNNYGLTTLENYGGGAGAGHRGVQFRRALRPRAEEPARL